MEPFCILEFDGAPSDVVTQNLKKATVTLNSGKDPDKIDIELSDPFSQLPRPREKAKIYCTIGYKGGKRRKHGPFVVDEYAGSFKEADGETLTTAD